MQYSGFSLLIWRICGELESEYVFQYLSGKTWARDSTCSGSNTLLGWVFLASLTLERGGLGVLVPRDDCRFFLAADDIDDWNVLFLFLVFVDWVVPVPMSIPVSLDMTASSAMVANLERDFCFVEPRGRPLVRGGGGMALFTL